MQFNIYHWDHLCHMLLVPQIFENKKGTQLFKSFFCNISSSFSSNVMFNCSVGTALYSQDIPQTWSCRSVSRKNEQCLIRGIHHKRHFDAGFMGDPSGQLKASAKSRELAKGMIMRYLSMVWSLFSMVHFRVSSLSCQQYQLAYPRKNNWSGVSAIPGSFLFVTVVCWSSDSITRIL